MDHYNNDQLFQKKVYFLAQTYFIKDNQHDLLLNAHKYDFDIFFFDQLIDFRQAELVADDDALFVVDLDVLYSLQTDRNNRTLFLNDLLKQLPANRQYIYLETEKQGGRFLLQKMLVDTNCLAYAEKPIANDLLVDKLFNLFARSRQNDMARVVYLGEHQPFDEAMLAGQAIELIHHADPQTLHRFVRQGKPDMVVIEDAAYEFTDVVARVIKKNLETDPSLEIVLFQHTRNAQLAAQAVADGFDEILPSQPSAILTQQLINRLDKIRINRNLISRDRATGLLNKVGLRTKAYEVIRRAAAGHIPLALGVIDIDKFKTINDTWGHYFGDIVIKRLSLTLANGIGAQDLLSRFGGEEFVLLFWNCTPDMAEAKLNQLREAFGRIVFEVTAGDQRQFSFSGGLAFYPRFKTENELFLHADEMLYQAKQNGRNRICA